MTTGALTAPPPAIAAPGHAGFVSRFLALAVDLFLASATLSWASWFVTALASAFGRRVPERLLDTMIALVPLIVFAVLVTCWRLWGQTPGKWLAGVRVVSVDGRPLTRAQCVVRALGYLASAIPLYAGFLWVLIDPERRALHDRLARTVVVYARPRVNAARL